VHGNITDGSFSDSRRGDHVLFTKYERLCGIDMFTKESVRFRIFETKRERTKNEVRRGSVVTESVFKCFVQCPNLFGSLKYDLEKEHPKIYYAFKNFDFANADTMSLGIAIEKSHFPSLGADFITKNDYESLDSAIYATIPDRFKGEFLLFYCLIFLLDGFFRSVDTPMLMIEFLSHFKESLNNFIREDPSGPKLFNVAIDCEFIGVMHPKPAGKKTTYDA
jgi:hypothetical protein